MPCNCTTCSFQSCSLRVILIYIQRIIFSRYVFFLLPRLLLPSIILVMNSLRLRRWQVTFNVEPEFSRTLIKFLISLNIIQAIDVSNPKRNNATDKYFFFYQEYSLNSSKISLGSLFFYLYK